MKKINIKDFANDGYCVRNFDGEDKRSSVRVPRALWNHYCEKCKLQGTSAYSSLSKAIKSRPEGVTQTQAAIYTLFLVASKDGVLE